MTQRHPKYPGSPPLAGARVERRRAAEEIDLAFGAGGAVKHADRTPRRCDRPHESLHRFVAGAVAVLLDQVLPDPLEAQSRIELLGDGGAVDRRGEAGPRGRAGERFGRVCL